MDIPLLLRLFEAVREDVSSDEELHFITERLAARQVEKSAMLDMSDYEVIIGPPNDEISIEARRPPERKEKITLEGSDECVERVLGLLAMIYFNGMWGHSGTFAIGWDGDGADFVEIKGVDFKKYKEMVEATSAYGSDVEMIGEAGTSFVGNVVPAEDEKSRPRISWKKVYPQEEVKAGLRILAADNRGNLERQLDELCNEIESYDAVLILGEDLTQTAPRMALSVRQAAKNKAKEMAAERRTQDWLAEPLQRIAQDAKSPIFILAATQTRLADVAAGEVVASPNDIARLGFAVAAAVKGDAILGLADDAKAFAQNIADTLKAAKKPLIISGTSLQDASIMEAAAQVAQTLVLSFVHRRLLSP
jgi:hypothetical protein